MYVHKYVANDDTFFRISKGSGKPAKSVTLTVSDWNGKVSENAGNVSRAIDFLKDAPWSVKEEEVKEEKKETKEAGKVLLSSIVRKIAESIQ
jgi:hypothetical protein